jgi:hypothetical protein
MSGLIFLSLAVLGPLVAVAWRRRSSPESHLGAGLGAGLIPAGVSAAWSVWFMVVYRDGYGTDGMEWMGAHRLVHYPVVAVATPFCANFFWTRSARAGVTRRLVLIGACLASTALCESTPVGWTFTFLLMPPALVVLLVGLLLVWRR